MTLMQVRQRGTLRRRTASPAQPPTTGPDPVNTAMLYAGTAETAGSGWSADTSPAVGPSSNTFITWSSSSSGATGYITLGELGLAAAIPAGSTINSVSASLDHYVSNASRYVAANCTIQLYDGTTPIGTPTLLSALPVLASAAPQTYTFTGENAPTVAQLANLRVRVSYRRASTTSASTVYFDFLGLQANYTPVANAPIVRDLFARTSTTTPGVAETGQTWVVRKGTWGTDGARLYSVSAADGDFLTLDCGSVNKRITISAPVLTGTHFARMWLRYAGEFAGYWWEITNGTLSLVRSFSGLGSAAVPAGAVIESWIREVDNGAGTAITVKANGTTVLDVVDTSADRPQNTLIGFRHGSSGTVDIRWSGLTVTAA